MERTPLLRSYSTSSASFTCQDFRIYELITAIRTDLLHIIDHPLSEEQLRGSSVLHNIIKPLENDYVDKNHAIIYSLLVNRLYFLRIQSSSLSLHSINATRAAVCEILAIRVLDRLRESNVLTIDDLLLCLANALVRCYSPFQGAPADAIPIKIASEEHLKGLTSALEIAIVSHAKLFIRSPAVQLVVQGIYTGKIVYAPTSFMDILPDHYKQKQITIYDPSHAPIFDHYRLKVPRVRQVMETTYFLILFVSYFYVLHQRHELPEDAPVTSAETWLILYSMGYTLDKIASVLEHGWSVFTANMWNGIDICYCLCFFVYLSLLVAGSGKAAHAILACGAVLLFPRLAFVTLSNNVLVLALRAMMADFFFLMFLAVWCFMGFLYALWTLGGGKYSVYDISKWMIWIWFGLDATGLSLAPEFHPIWGPVLFVAYACLSTTLLLTVLVSILATRFAEINGHSIEEYMFREAVEIFEGIKSDAIFNYWPPMNLLAVTILTPIRFVMTPRRFHSLNVLCTRISAGPILILIALIERRLFHAAKNASPISADTGIKAIRGISRFEARADVEALLHLFAEECHGLGHEPRRRPSRHLSVSSMMELDAGISDEGNEVQEENEWRKAFSEKLGRIEHTLLALSRSKGKS